MWRGHLLLGTVNQLVLVGALIAGSDALVLPQSLGVLVEFLQGAQERPSEAEPAPRGRAEL